MPLFIDQFQLTADKMANAHRDHGPIKLCLCMIPLCLLLQTKSIYKRDVKWHCLTNDNNICACEKSKGMLQQNQMEKTIAQY